MELKFLHLNKSHRIEIEKTGLDLSFTIEGKKYEPTDIIMQDNIISFQLKGERQNIYYTRTREQIYLAIEGDTYILVPDQGKKSRRTGVSFEKGDSVSSPMPGLLVKVLASVGEEVKAGKTLAVVEAMKMQNELRAPRDGVVKKIHYKEGEQVDALKAIVELK